MKKQILVVLLALVLVFSMVSLIACVDPEEPTTYTLTYAAGGGSGTAPAAEQLKEGAEITLKAANTFTAPEGKEFDGWLVDGTKKAAGDKITMPAKDLTITAQWKTTNVTPEPETVTLYFYNVDGWDAVAAYSWYGEGADEVRPLGNWPGTAMTAVTGHEGWMQIAIEESVLDNEDVKIIFNGTGAQTKNLPLADAEHVYFAKNGAYTSFADAEAGSLVPPETLTVYYYNSEEWANVYAYVYTGDPLGSWPGTEMTAVDGNDNWYEIAIDEDLFDGTKNIIFTNNSGAQTANLPIADSTNLYYIYVEKDAAVVEDYAYASFEEAEEAVNPQPEPETWTVTFKNGDVTVATVTVEKGQKLTAGQIPTLSGIPADKMLDGWYDGETKIDENATIDGDITAIAKIVDKPGDEAGEYTIETDEGTLTVILDGFGSITGTIVGDATDQTYFVLGDYIICGSTGITLNKEAGTATIVDPLNGGIEGTYKKLVVNSLSDNVVLTMYSFGAFSFEYYDSSYIGVYTVNSGKIVIDGINTELNGAWIVTEDGSVLSNDDGSKLYVDENYDLTSHLSDFTGSSDGSWADSENNLVLIINVAIGKVTYGGQTVDFAGNLNNTRLTFVVDGVTYTLKMQDGSLVIASGEETIVTCVPYEDVATVTFVNGTDEQKITVQRGEKIANAPADPEPEQGYVFAGWFAGIARFDASAAVTADVTYVAKFAAEPTEEGNLSDLLGEWTLNRERYTITTTSVTYSTYDKDAEEWYEEDSCDYTAADFVNGKLTVNINGDELVLSYNSATDALIVTDESGDSTEFPNTAKPEPEDNPLYGTWEGSRKSYAAKFVFTATTVSFTLTEDGEVTKTVTGATYSVNGIQITINDDYFSGWYISLEDEETLMVSDADGEMFNERNFTKTAGPEPEPEDNPLYGTWEGSKKSYAAKFVFTATTVSFTLTADGEVTKTITGATYSYDGYNITINDSYFTGWYISLEDEETLMVSDADGEMFNEKYFEKTASADQPEPQDPTTYVGEWLNGDSRLVINESTVEYYYLVDAQWLLVDSVSYTEQSIANGKLSVAINGVTYTIEYVGSVADGYRLIVTDANGAVSHYLTQGKGFMFGTWQGTLNGEDITFSSVNGVNCTIIWGDETLNGLTYEHKFSPNLDGKSVSFLAVVDVDSSVMGCSRYFIIDNGDGTVTAYATDVNTLLSDNPLNIVLTFKGAAA